MRVKRGDTMIEVMFAIAVFALVSVLTIIVMNSGVATIEATLELSMARNEVDAQSEALRFIHNSFLSERELTLGEQGYANIWKRLKTFVNDSSSAILPITVDDCAKRYELSGSDSIYSRKTIILNTRRIDPSSPGVTIQSATVGGIFKPSPLSPRLVFSKGSENTDTTFRDNFTTLTDAEGIWIIPVESAVKAPDGVSPEFYDFHVYTCWTAPGRDRSTTIGTIMRLYNPELFEVGK